MSRDPSKGYALWSGIEIDSSDPEFVLDRPALFRRKVAEAVQNCDRILATTPKDVEALLHKAALFLGPYLGETFPDQYGRMEFVSIPPTKGDITARFPATFWISQCEPRMSGLFTIPDVDPTCGEPLYWVSVREGDPERTAHTAGALEVFGAVVDVEPENLKALWWRGFILHRLKRRRKANDCYDLMLQRDPDDAWTLSAKGDCLHHLRQYDEAAECYLHAFELRESHAYLRRRIAALRKAGRSKAVEECKTQIRDLLRRSDDRDVARRFLQRVAYDYRIQHGEAPASPADTIRKYCTVCRDTFDMVAYERPDSKVTWLQCPCCKGLLPR